MSINWGFFQFHSWSRDASDDFMGAGCWFRIFGHGLHFNNGQLLFSERNGHSKFLKLPFGYRVKFLRRSK